MQRAQRRFWLGTSWTIAVGISWILIEQLLSSGPVEMYLARWVLLPLAWVFAILFRRAVRSALADTFERFQPNWRVPLAATTAAVVLAYAVLVVARMPAPITRVPIKPGIGSIGTTTPDIVILPDSPDADRQARKGEDQQEETASRPSNEAQAQPANRRPNPPPGPPRIMGFVRADSK